MEARKIIITGGATRIGAAIAKKLSGPNKEILIHFNKSKLKAEKLKKELSNNGTKVYLVKGDLSKEKDVIFAEKLTKAIGVASIPISVFYGNPPNEQKLRFCFAKEDSVIEEAAKKLCSL